MPAQTIKHSRLILSATAAALMTVNAIAARPDTEQINLRYVEVSEISGMVKQQLGPEAASAITAVHQRTNSLTLSGTHPDAKKVQELIASLDQAVPAMKVTAVIKRVIPATPGAPAREEIISRPTIMGHPGHPLKLSIPDGKQGALEVELLITPLKP